jgi:hypothetical protein
MHRMAIEQQLLDRIVGETVAIVGIRIAARDPEDALRDQIAQRVRHAIGIASVDEAGGDPRGQVQPAIGRAQQHRAPVRAGVRLIERRDERLRDKVLEEDRLCYRVVVQRQRLRW